MDTFHKEDTSLFEILRRNVFIEGEFDVRGGELNVGGFDEDVVDVGFGWGAIEVEWHVAGGIGHVTVFGVEWTIFDGVEGGDFDVFGEGFARRGC